MTDTILYDSAFRLFEDLVAPERVARQVREEQAWPTALWQTVEEAGYLDVLAEGPAGMVEAATILRAAGHHAAPIPLAETMLARWLCARCRLETPTGTLTIAPVEPADRIMLVGGALAGRAGFIPWAHDAAAIAVMAEGRLWLAAPAEGSVERDVNLAGEPRDHLVSLHVEEANSAPLPNEADAALVLRLGALARAAQMAGAMEAALALATRYANDRVQFGRPIAKFQAIQQQLALLAEEAAAALVAVENAARAVAEARPSAAFAAAAAKVRAGEAAGKVAEIAHQVHGAIGFTQEHSLHRLTRRLWSWRDEFGTEAYWSRELGRLVASDGADALWPMMTRA
ncbi:MAG: acyl-CoA dehydrogenase [Alphaproteobacteria bacterium]|nr:acyl-CoA dehydrogenase [Alphaproteobacteria bacterium]